MKNVVEHIKKLGIPLTRENYLDFAYLGDPPPEPLDPELEAELPEQFSKYKNIEDKPSTRRRR